MSIPDSLNVNTNLSGSVGAVVSGGATPLGIELEGLEDVNVEIGGIPNRPLDVDLGLEVGGMETPVGLEFGGGESPIDVDLGLEVGGIPDQPLDVDLGLEVGGTETPVGLEFGGGENPIVIDVGLDDINLEVGGGENPIAVDLGLDDINVDLGLDNINVCLSLALTEIPSARVHLPAKYEFGFNLFGVSIFNFNFKGDTALITEDNPPRIFHQPEELAPPMQGSSDLPYSAGGSDIAYTVKLNEEADEE